MLRLIRLSLIFFTYSVVSLWAGPELELYDSLLNLQKDRAADLIQNNPLLLDKVSDQVYRVVTGDREYSSEGLTPLLFTLRYDLDAMTRLLLETGADPNAAGTDGGTPLALAASRGNTLAVRWLLTAGARREEELENHHTALTLAMANGRFETADFLVEQGARLYEDSPVEDPLAGQIYSRKIQIRESMMLLDKGLPSHHLLEAAQNGDYQRARALLEQGFDPDGRDSAGITPLLEASYHGRGNMVKLLLESGASVNGADLLESRPLSLAAAMGELRILETLLEEGADPNRGDSLEYTALYHSLIYHQEQAFEKLLEQDIYLDRRDSQGRTIIMIAAYMGDLRAVDLLLEKGIASALTDREGLNAVYYAVNAFRRNSEEDYFTVVDRLIASGVNSKPYASLAGDPEMRILLEARFRY